MMMNPESYPHINSFQMLTKIKKMFLMFRNKKQKLILLMIKETKSMIDQASLLLLSSMNQALNLSANKRGKVLPKSLSMI